MSTYTKQEALRLVRGARLRSASKKVVLFTLASRMRASRLAKDGCPVVTTTYRQLANDCAMARSTCISTVKQLCALGLITKHTTEKKNHYTILLHNIKQLRNE